MRYVDSTLDHDAGDRLAGWLGQELPTCSVLTLRTGFFSARAIGVVQDGLEGLLGRGGELLAVVGGDLLQCDVAALRVLLGLCRRFPQQARVFVMVEPAFQNAKTYHLQHSDGHSSAWVGSANFTIGGFASNLEAAIIVNSDNDDSAVIDQVRAATVAATGHPAAAALDQAVLHQLERRVREARLAPPGTVPARPSPLIVDHCHLLLDRLDRATTPAGPTGTGGGGVLQVLPTGFIDLDTVLAGGLRPGTVSVIASRPGGGRSTLVLNVLTHAAVGHRAAAGLYSFEFTDDEAVLRIVAATTGIRLLDLRHGRLDEQDWTRLADTMSGLADAPLYLDCGRPPHLDALCVTITAAVARDGLDLVAVDPANLILAQPPCDRPERPLGQVGEVLRRLKHLAMQLRIHIVVTAELDRPTQPGGLYRREGDRPPHVDDLREHDAVMELADVVVLLHRPDAAERDHPRGGEADLFVVKNRYGLLGTVTITHQLHYARFTSLTAPAPAPPASLTTPPTTTTGTTPTTETPPPTTPPQSDTFPPPVTAAPADTQPVGGAASGVKERLVTIGGVEVVVRIVDAVGAGDPPVIFLGRAEPAVDEWAGVADRLKDFTRIVTYRRPRGGGDPLTEPIADGAGSIYTAVAQLHGLLTEARIAPPVVLVACSFGAWVADQYAARRPRDVTGMILIDPVNLTPWPDLHHTSPAPDGNAENTGNDDETGYLLRPSATVYAELARPAVTRPRRTAVISSADGRWQRLPPRTGGRVWDPRTLAEMDRLWQGYQRDWVQRLNARHVTATDAGHLVHRDQPDLVARIITDVVHAACTRTGLHLDKGAVAKRGGRLTPRT